MKKILSFLCLHLFAAPEAASTNINTMSNVNTSDQLAKALQTAFDQYSHEVKAQMLGVIQEIMKQAANGKQVTIKEAEQSITQITQQAMKNLDSMPKHILETVFAQK